MIVIIYFSGLTSYLNVVHDVYMPPHRNGYCDVSNAAVFTVFLCSALLIISMTFERFYSIIKPHKAASFNTVKRAKITIISIVFFTICYSILHLFISSVQGRQYLPYGTAMGKLYGEVYYWLSFIVLYALPFTLLLTMNCVIIHKIRNRANTMNKRDILPNNIADKGQGQIQGQFQGSNLRAPDKQVYAILLLVTFGFLILTMPAYLLFLFIMIVDFTQSPVLYAGYYLLYHIAQKLHYTNHGINFFFYVISGTKFRRDLLKLFHIDPQESPESVTCQSSETNTHCS